jgi:hypothetical protein
MHKGSTTSYTTAGVHEVQQRQATRKWWEQANAVVGTRAEASKGMELAYIAKVSPPTNEQETIYGEGKGEWLTACQTEL